MRFQRQSHSLGALHQILRTDAQPPDFLVGEKPVAYNIYGVHAKYIKCSLCSVEAPVYTKEEEIDSLGSLCTWVFFSSFGTAGLGPNRGSRIKENAKVLPKSSTVKLELQLYNHHSLVSRHFLFSTLLPYLLSG